MTQTKPDNEVVFSVQGSAPEPYQVRFIKRSSTKLNAYCTCPAGQKGMHCKHRIRILAGYDNDIVSGNIGDVPRVAKWVVGTDLEAALDYVVTVEDQFKGLKKQLAAAKKAMAREMLQ